MSAAARVWAPAPVLTVLSIDQYRGSDDQSPSGGPIAGQANPKFWGHAGLKTLADLAGFPAHLQAALLL